MVLSWSFNLILFILSGQWSGWIFLRVSEKKRLFVCIFTRQCGQDQLFWRGILRRWSQGRYRDTQSAYYGSSSLIVRCPHSGQTTSLIRTDSRPTKRIRHVSESSTRCRQITVRNQTCPMFELYFVQASLRILARVSHSVGKFRLEGEHLLKKLLYIFKFLKCDNLQHGPVPGGNLECWPIAWNILFSELNFWVRSLEELSLVMIRRWALHKEGVSFTYFLLEQFRVWSICPSKIETSSSKWGSRFQFIFRTGRSFKVCQLMR